VRAHATRRLLIGLVLLTIVCIASVFIAARRQDGDPQGDTEPGARGFPLRGSLADDNDAMDAAVAEGREKTKKEAEEDDADSRKRQARRPDPWMTRTSRSSRARGLVLAAAGDVETAHALVGAQEVSRKGPIVVIDARRFDDGVETGFFGRTTDGAVVAPLRQPGSP
jgi:hypothetical protein